MYENGKMIPVETLSGIRGGGDKENSGGVNSSVIYFINCKNSCKCYNVTPPSTIMKILSKKESSHTS
jgi:hypothetical protein